nr:2-oxoisovalerate dehydrogenase subunit alpha 1, mitochondrial-like [Tanacetum cinerariifolium]
WWTQNEDSELHIDVHKQVKNAIDEAEREEKPALEDMFKDVYEEPRLCSYAATMDGLLALLSRTNSEAMALLLKAKLMEFKIELFSSEDDGITSFEENHVHGLEYPGGKIAFTSEMNFLPGSSEVRVKCYRLLDQDGYPISSNMPEHVGKELALKIYKLNYFTISAPLATQLPHAVGVAYSLKNDRKDACVVTYFGEGSTSEGDFHAGMNFAAVLEAPLVFICRNNGWAISTPVTDQFLSDGIVVKGQAYGIQRECTVLQWLISSLVRYFVESSDVE